MTTILIHACKRGNVDLVRCLLERGADPNLVLRTMHYFDKNNALFSVIDVGIKDSAYLLDESRFDIVHLLIEYGFDIEEDLMNDLLHTTIFYGKSLFGERVAEILLSYGFKYDLLKLIKGITWRSNTTFILKNLLTEKKYSEDILEALIERFEEFKADGFLEFFRERHAEKIPKILEVMTNSSYYYPILTFLEEYNDLSEKNILDLVENYLDEEYCTCTNHNCDCRYCERLHPRSCECDENCYIAVRDNLIHKLPVETLRSHEFFTKTIYENKNLSAIYETFSAVTGRDISNDKLALAIMANYDELDFVKRMIVYDIQITRGNFSTAFSVAGKQTKEFLKRYSDFHVELVPGCKYSLNM